MTTCTQNQVPSQQLYTFVQFYIFTQTFERINADCQQSHYCYPVLYHNFPTSICFLPYETNQLSEPCARYHKYCFFGEISPIHFSIRNPAEVLPWPENFFDEGLCLLCVIKDIKVLISPSLTIASTLSSSRFLLFVPLSLICLCFFQFSVIFFFDLSFLIVLKFCFQLFKQWISTLSFLSILQLGNYTATVKCQLSFQPTTFHDISAIQQISRSISTIRIHMHICQEMQVNVFCVCIMRDETIFPAAF